MVNHNAFEDFLAYIIHIFNWIVEHKIRPYKLAETSYGNQIFIRSFLETYQEKHIEVNLRDTIRKLDKSKESLR